MGLVRRLVVAAALLVAALATTPPAPAQPLDPATPGRPAIEVVASVGHEVTRIVVSRDGRWIVTGSSEQVKVWEAASGRLLRSFPAADDTNGAGGIAISPDSRLLAIGNSARRSGSKGSAVSLYDIATGRRLRTHTGAPWACDIAFAPNGATMVSAGCGRDSEISLWTVANTARTRALKHFGGVVLHVALSPDGGTLYAYGRDKRTGPRTLRAIDLTGSRPARVLAEAAGTFAFMTLAADGSVLAVDAPGEVRLLDPASGTVRRAIAIKSEEFALAPDGQRIAIRSVEPDALTVFDTATGAKVFALPIKADAIAYARDGRTIVVSNNGQAEVRDAATGELIRLLGGRVDPVTAIAAEPVGPMMVAGTTSGRIYRWDTLAGALRHATPAHKSEIARLFVVKGGGFFASATRDAQSVWQTGDGSRLVHLAPPKDVNEWIQGIALMPAGDRLTSLVRRFPSDTEREAAEKAGRSFEPVDRLDLRRLPAGGVIDTRAAAPGLAQTGDGRRRVTTGAPRAVVRLHDAATGRLLRDAVFEGLDVSSLALSPDASRAVVAGESGMDVRDMASGRRIKQLSATWLRDTMPALYSPDGRWLAVATPAGVEILEAATLARAHLLPGLKSDLSKMAFSPDSRFLAYGRLVENPRNWEVVIWEVASGTRQKALPLQAAPVLDIAFSPDGARIAVVLYSTLTVYDRATGRQVRRWSNDKASSQTAVFTPDGRGIASNADNAVLVRDIATGATRARYAGLEPPGEKADAVTRLAYSADRSHLLIVYRDGAVQRVNVATGRTSTQPGNTGEETATMPLPGAGQVARLWSGRPLVVEDISGAGPPQVIARIESFASGSEVLQISGDGRFVAAGGTIYTGSAVHVFETETGRLVRSVPANARQIALAFDGAWVAAVDTRGLVYVAAAAGGAPRRLDVGRSWDVQIAPGGDPRHLLVGGRDGTVKVFDALSGRLLATMIANPAGEWVVLTPEGFFAASSPEAAGLLSIVRGTEIIGIDQLYQSLYRPDLVQQKLAGDPKGLVREAAAKLDVARLLDSGVVPKVALVSHRPGDKVATDLVTVEADIADQGGGVGRIEWRLNGLTIGIIDTLTPGGDRGALTVNRSNGGLRQDIYLDPGPNLIEVVAYNRANLVASIPARVRLERQGGGETRRPRLFVLAIGVDDYFDSRLILKYAKSDATRLIAALKAAGEGLYEGEVQAVPLLDTQVTVARIDAAFKDLAAKIRPNDVFVFFAAGHGVTHEGRYYFLPRDFRFQTAASYATDAIGQDRWQAWFATIAARKSLLLFDTCESGTLVEDASTAGVRGGLMQAAAIGRLIQATGRLWLTASAGDTPAREGYRGHGVFTYTLLDALGRADRNDNALIEVSELVGHVDAWVPEITFKRWGQRQVPQRNNVGADFPLGRQVAALSPATDPDAVVISKTPTHIVPDGGGVFAQPGGQGALVRTLQPFTLVTVIKEAGEERLVAKDGEKLGYIAAARLKPVQ